MIKFLNYFSFFLFGIFSLSSCGGGAAVESGDQKEFITDAAPNEDTLIEGYVSLSPEIGVELEKYFSPELCLELDQYVNDYVNLQTELDFENNYRDGRKLSQKMYDQLYKPVTPYLTELAKENEYWDPMETIYQDLEIFKDELGPISLTCVAECTEIEFIFDLTKLLEKAKQTDGKADDSFMDLVIFIEGEWGYAGYPGFKSWFLQTWDLGGASLLGDGILLSAIEKAIKFQKEYDLFDAELKLIREDFVDELTWVTIYQYTPEKVLEEFDAILALKYFTKAELVDIMKLYDRIKNQDSELQFDCENNDCAYG